MAINFYLDMEIRRPPADVFAVVTDPQRLPDWQPLVVEVEVLGGGPLREGSRIREVRQVARKRLEQLVEVSALEPARRFGLRIVDGPLAVHGDLSFSETQDGGTLLRLHAHGRGRGPMRVLEPVMPPVLRRQLEGQYRRLKEVCEAS